MKLSDNVIAHVAKLIQLAILTGTDIVDHMRTIRLRKDPDTGELFLDEEYEKQAEENIVRMVNDIEAQINNDV